MFDVLIVGGGVSGVSCALILGSAYKKAFVQDKNIVVITHQKTSSLQEAVFYNAYGISSGKLGSEILTESIQQLQKNYPHVTQIEDEKVVSVAGQAGNFVVVTTKNTYQTRIIVIGIGSSNLFSIDGLQQYIEPHNKSLAEKNRIQLQNTDQKVANGIYVVGTLAGHRSQLAIAAGSGAAVATDILTLWNNGVETHVHDSIKK
ncbi:pyridine nucleotide-disulfide oxidoreductase [Flavobacterium psychrophilum]|uniref:Pyridine nucleotide-disulphide oxidoreductase, class-II family protein n=1 Tax=Flavobacterium psychrophilum (strain ATCC 49511 / DSM 21280 / CIP 103535 / JIP02/86) TaxID=402612 RepID=A6GWV0_FLAPJ|nr:FAD-dependent oxidoreductase [Flavobacterium psychrophilum]AIG29377.1 pyridine nucleotide-disulfide oxidoreductase [Flavobacterium psychrophilum]AIG31654.1 pyridine nucleotide-disulfide oxidoreductase [Flavobacterium psychrophilum]AIG33808.1 pyridine nucleotide-disulfide oxidoreductase [Flavobacterium psychrophilum]AIG36170.1 pyridine nucleotide-disulfide oxidoreductase [Flavobacterium psychrophilum]AIG38436.1 pyridine nucleotide-disulfide oxidoreductase [Flavobacterium psychrophilum]